MDAKFSQRIKDVLTYSKEEAIRLGNKEIGPEHLFLGILREGEGVAINVLISLRVNLYELRKDIEATLASAGPVKVTETDNIPLLKSSERVLKLVYLEAKSLKNTTIDTGHLLLAIIKDEDSIISRVLYEHNISYEKVRKEILREREENTESEEISAEFPHEEDDTAGAFGSGKGGGSEQSSKSSSDTPVLDNFGIDLLKRPRKTGLILL